MGRRPTAPIPSHLRSDLYRAAWSIATDGRLCRSDGSIVDLAGTRGQDPHVFRRHALGILWGTAIAARFSELANLRIRDLAAAGFRVWVNRSKGGIHGWVDVCDSLVSLTIDWRSERQLVKHSVWLLPNRCGNRIDNRNFNRHSCGLFSKLFGVPITSHSLRDTACQIAMDEGWRMRDVQRCLGHRRVSTTEIYGAKVAAQSLRLPIYEPNHFPGAA